MTDKHTLVERLNNSDWGPNVTDALTRWAMERAEAANRITALEAREALLVHILEAITAMQALRYGDATRTHMALIGLCVTARATLAKARQSDEGE